MKNILIYSFIVIYIRVGIGLSSKLDSNNDVQRKDRFLELFSVIDEYSYSLFKQSFKLLSTSQSAIYIVGLVT